jgi:hypothetical protein
VDTTLSAGMNSLNKPARPPQRPRRAAPVKPRKAPAHGRRAQRESELEFAAAGLEGEYGASAEQIEIDVPGIPGDNQWFSNAGQARRAALRAATAAGPGFTIAHDGRPGRGQPHYHVVGPGGVRVSGHFFYGNRVPRRVFRGRPTRESQLGFIARELEYELAGG